MKTYRIAASAAVLMLAACGPAAEEPPPAPAAVEATQEPTEEPTQEPTTPEPTTATPTLTSADLLVHCETQEPQQPIGQAIAETELPDGTLLAAVDEFPPAPGAEGQDSTWVAVTLCSVPLNGDEQRAIATDLAFAAAGVEGPGIYRFAVNVEVPQRDGSLYDWRKLYVEDFGTYNWDRDEVPAADSLWLEMP